MALTDDPTQVDDATLRACVETGKLAAAELRRRTHLQREEGLKDANYHVMVNGTPWPAATEEEAWDIIGRHPMGSLYSVSSPKGLEVSQFIPY